MTPGSLVLSARFKVLRHIGGGGMSEVYLGEQVSLGRRVALKVLKRHLGRQPEMAERFRREARLLSTVEHPAVVRVIDFESTPEATVLVLELAEGDTLERVLRDGPLSVERALPILAQLAEGLAAIHQRGIVHRDVKPQNVVLTTTPRGEQARMLDFGIARLIELHDSSRSNSALNPNPFVSSPGLIVGTPAFVAPEQVTGEPVDARADVYAFGVLAFRALSGKYPFAGPGSRDFLDQHVSAVPRRLDEVMPSLKAHRDLVRLLMRCLNKKPADRPQSAQALLEELLRMLPSSPLESAVNTPSRRVLAPAPDLFDTSAVARRGHELLARWRQALTPSLSAAAQALGRLKVQARRLSPEWRRSALAVAVACCCAPLIWALVPPTPGERAATLIAAGRPSDALTLLNSRLGKVPSEAPELLALKAAALHGLHSETFEREVLRANTYQALQAAHPLLLDALAEDFAADEDDRELHAFLQTVPERFLLPHFEALASGNGSVRQWGALRWLDVVSQTEGLDLVDRYSAALAAPPCFIKAAAASRLAELGQQSALPALRQLSETPKDETAGGEPTNCGQDEAAEAVRQLKKRQAMRSSSGS